MDEARFPTPAQIDQRADQIIDGIGYPHLPALPDLAFRRLTLAERGEASRAYSAFLKEDMAQGGRFSEPMLMTELRRRCLEVGLNYDQLMAQEEAFQRRIFEQAPAELRNTEPRLSDEEFATLTDEAKQEYLEELKTRGLAINEFFANLFTPEEQIIRGQVSQVKELHAQLRANTYEHHARIRRRCVEILHGARCPVDGLSPEQWQPYFSSLEEIYELEDTDQAAWLALATKWREFKEGKWPGFTRRSSSTHPTGNA